MIVKFYSHKKDEAIAIENVTRLIQAGPSKDNSYAVEIIPCKGQKDHLLFLGKDFKLMEVLNDK